MEPKQSPPVALAEDEEEIIELTEVVAEAPTEIVLELGNGTAELAGIGSLAPASPSEESHPTTTAAPRDESLDDLLASLPDLSEELELPSTAPVAGVAGKTKRASETGQLIPEAELREMVRETIRETVERLTRELLPEMAAQALERQFQRLKKRLLEDDAGAEET